MENKTTAKPELSVNDRLYEKGVKTLEKHVETGITNDLQQGASAQELINKLSQMKSQNTSVNPPINSDQQIANQLASMDTMKILNYLANEKVQVPGRENFFSRVMSAGITNDPMQLFGPKMARRGEEKAINKLSVLINANEAERRQGSSMRKAPGEIAKSEMEQIKLGYEKGQISTAGLDPAVNPAFAKEYQQEAVKMLAENRQELNKFTINLRNGLSSTEKIEKAGVELGDFQEGFFNQIGARGEVAYKKFTKTPQFEKFKAIINQEAANISRKIGGERGATTENDIQRVFFGAGSETTPMATKLALLDEIRQPLFDELNTRLEIAQINPKDHEKRFPDIAKIKNKVTKRSEQRMQSRVLNPLQAKESGATELDTETGEYFNSDGKVIGRKK